MFLYFSKLQVPITQLETLERLKKTVDTYIGKELK